MHDALRAANFLPMRTRSKVLTTKRVANGPFASDNNKTLTSVLAIDEGNIPLLYSPWRTKDYIADCMLTMRIQIVGRF